MLTTSLIPQKQEDNQEQSYYLDLHGHDTTLLRKRFLVIVVALVACIGASICDYYTAIIYASFYAGEEARRPPWKYLREIDVTDMLCIHAAAFTLGALTLDKLNDSGGGWCRLHQLILLPLPSSLWDGVSVRIHLSTSGD
ncbi:hypothetical protein C5167_049018 [Papaver somniferum]|uniref:Uncharacterized protein n=1 Tax=Papaver somniferum TaxID=3469 RepID=A0A4Y7KMB1_PAPSO|nr:hypothetical protein C5167_049018 [Papaver somniferum]